MTQPMAVGEMTERQRAAFYAYWSRARKDEAVGVVLAFFLGGLGAHHFYLRRTGLGLLYLLFSWTGIPVVLGLIECFFMPGRVRRFNQEQARLAGAAAFAGAYPAAYPGAPLALHAPGALCPACGRGSALGVRYCGRCGTAMA